LRDKRRGRRRPGRAGGTHSHPKLSQWGACLLALLLATCGIRYHKNSFHRFKDAG